MNRILSFNKITFLIMFVKLLVQTCQSERHRWDFWHQETSPHHLESWGSSGGSWSSHKSRWETRHKKEFHLREKWVIKTSKPWPNSKKNEMQGLGKVFIHLELFHILLRYKHKLQSVCLGFYEIDQHQIVKWKISDTIFKYLFYKRKEQKWGIQLCLVPFTLIPQTKI